MKNIFLRLIIVSYLLGTTILSAQECVKCDPISTNNGDFATALGQNTNASGNASLSTGAHTTSEGYASTAMGFRNIAEGSYSFSMGSFTHSFADFSFVIGRGYLENNKLENNMPNSLMIGFNSNIPTFFVGMSDHYGKTGRIAIGHIVDENGYMTPQAKLHIRADDGEDAAVFIEPNNWDSGGISRLMLGNTFHSITTNNLEGMKFESENNFIFNGNNLGFGVEEPKAKVHINGDLLFENSLNGIIMKSEDGNCWKGTISNNGELMFLQVDCETLVSAENISEPKHSEVFIYPNPTNGKITVEYTGNKKNLRLEIKTINGLLVATHKIKKGENKIELNNIPDQMIVASIFTKKGELISTNKVVIKN